jgi:hypothetical protein
MVTLKKKEKRIEKKEWFLWKKIKKQIKNQKVC